MVLTWLIHQTAITISQLGYQVIPESEPSPLQPPTTSVYHLPLAEFWIRLHCATLSTLGNLSNRVESLGLVRWN
jgi:hypothetical protein